MKREDIVIKKGKKKFKTAPPETGVIQVTSLLNTNLYDFHELIARCLVGIEVESGIEYETFDKVVAKYHEPEDCNYSWEGIELSTKLKGGYGSYGYGIEEFFDYIINGYQSEYKSKSVDIEENVSDLAKRLWAYSEAQFYDVTEHTLEEMQFLSESHARKILTDIQKYDAEIYALEQYMANEMKVLIEKLYEEGTKPKTSAERFLNDIVKSRIEDLKLQKIMQMEESTCNFYLHCYELLGRDPI